MAITLPVLQFPAGLTLPCALLGPEDPRLLRHLSGPSGTPPLQFAGACRSEAEGDQIPAVYPKSAMLFIEGQQPRAVFVLCTGKAKLSTSSAEGKTIITKISEPGDVLGLNATISNRPYEVTAEVIEPGQADFITRDTVLHFLREYGEVAL
jgi:CRP/FNR family cyclic AMP-dependent transcriptional regulator